MVDFRLIWIPPAAALVVPTALKMFDGLGDGENHAVSFQDVAFFEDLEPARPSFWESL